MKTHHSILTILAVAAGFAVIAIGCGGGSSRNGAIMTASVMTTGSHTFNPVNATIAAGGTVTWSNPDVANHTVTSDTGVAGFGSDTQYPSGLPSGSTYSFTVPAGTASGTIFYYHCRFHGSAGNGTSIGAHMAGSITVQ